MSDMNRYYFQYPWSVPAGCCCGEETTGTTTEGGMTPEQVEALIDKKLTKYPTTDEENLKLLEYFKKNELPYELLEYAKKSDLQLALSDVCTVVQMQSYLDRHSNLKAGSATLAHVKPVDKNVEMTEPVGVDGDGRLWVKPTSLPVPPEPTPVQKDRYYYIPVSEFTVSDLNNKIVELANKGGGTIELGAGEFVITDTIYLDGAVRLIGQGRKNTVIYAKPKLAGKTTIDDMIFIRNTAKYFALKDFTLCGNYAFFAHGFDPGRSIDDNLQNLIWWDETTQEQEWGYAKRGIYFEARSYNLSPNTSAWAIERTNLKLGTPEQDSPSIFNGTEVYKEEVIRDISVVRCSDYGISDRIDTTQGVPCAMHFMSDITVAKCGFGIYTISSDTMLNNIYVSQCYGSGLYLKTGNSRISNVKVFNAGTKEFTDLNGKPSYSKVSGAVAIGGDRNMISNIEAQDNMTNVGIQIAGQNNILNGLMADCNYNVAGEAVGIKVTGTGNIGFVSAINYKNFEIYANKYEIPEGNNLTTM